MSLKDLNGLETDLMNGKVTNLRKQYEQILFKSIQNFKNNTEYYDEKIANSTIAEIKENLDKEFEKVFKLKNEELIKEYMNSFKVEISNTMNNK